MDEPIIGIDRHRIGSDGVGVTTLVAFHDCPLNCKFCLNPQCKKEEELQKVISPEELLDYVKIDSLYFLATGGGITFGGGEPLLKADFIAHFCRMADKEWKINVETSLNIPLGNLQKVAPFIDRYIIDIKDMNADIYKRYTGMNNSRVIDNLKWLAVEGLSDKVIVRIPLIPDYNSRQDQSLSKSTLINMGFKEFDEFRYIRK